MKKKHIGIHTVGCRANQADSATMAGTIDGNMVDMVDESQADIVIVNTCCVTNAAERDSKKIIRRHARDGKKVVITGCAVSALKDFADEFDKNDVFVAGSGKTSPFEVANRIDHFVKSGNFTINRDNENYFTSDSITPHTEIVNLPGRTRGFLKIQNGCTHNCTYCIVPSARGREQSMPLELIIQNVQNYKNAGYKELVLTGVQIGAWGKDFPQMLTKVAQTFLPGRVRLSSIEPWSVNEALLQVFADNKNICPHLHIPLQSGDDQILSDMKRGYTVSDYSDLFQMARQIVPDMAIGTDIICGFPTENEEQFQNTINVLQKLRPAFVHSFSYSDRTKTIAHKKYGPGNRTIAKDRVRQLSTLVDTLKNEFIESSIGQTRQVLIQENNKGLTDTFLQIKCEGSPGDLIKKTITKKDII